MINNQNIIEFFFGRTKHMPGCSYILFNLFKVLIREGIFVEIFV